ncbi:16S rRNA (cytidine(1402)-2'-O)-methyltransferase [Desulfobacterales bacterium HSG2]|nr:16S rRNA (cytidine(1402)-2'-O)-methyltransferase [Desulfobacterales bacterium HSG2]
MSKKGRLYIVATPIGNKDDITLRALNILRTADFVAAEDTRHTGKFLAFHNIRARLVSCHEYNERERIPGLIDKLEAGASVAIVSNAGTPSVSDPGYRLIKAAIANDIEVVPVPGVSAVITAISAAGLPTDSFLFAGFLPKKKGKRLTLLKSLADQPRTLVFYESPRRVPAFIEEIIQIMGDRHGVLAREMTKLHEEFLRGDLSEILRSLKERPVIKGECTLLVTGCDKERNVSMETVRSEIEKGLEIRGVRLSELSKKIAKKYGLPKNEVYEEALKLRLDV